MFFIASCTIVNAISDWQSGAYICGSLDRFLHLSPCRSTVQVDDIVPHLTFAPDSHLLAITTIHSVILWDVATHTIVRRVPLVGPTDPPINARMRSDFSPDGSTLATIGLLEVQVINVALGTVRYRIPVLDADSNGGGVRFSPDGRFLAVSELVHPSPYAVAGLVRIFDTATGQLIQTLPGGLNLARFDLQFTPDSHQLVLWAHPHDDLVTSTVQIWDITTQQYTERISGVDAVSPEATLLLTDTTLYTLTASGDHYTILRQLDRACGGEWNGFVPQRDLVISVDNWYGQEFVAPSSPTTCVWRLHDGKAIWQSRAQGEFITVAPNGTLFAIDTQSNVQVWDIPAEWN